MSALEVESWARFEHEFGPLTIQERLDAAAAKVAYIVHASAGGQLPPERFRQQWRAQRTWTEDGMWDWLAAQAKGSG